MPVMLAHHQFRCHFGRSLPHLSLSGCFGAVGRIGCVLLGQTPILLKLPRPGVVHIVVGHHDGRPLAVPQGRMLASSVAPILAESRHVHVQSQEPLAVRVVPVEPYALSLRAVAVNYDVGLVPVRAAERSPLTDPTVFVAIGPGVRYVGQADAIIGHLLQLDVHGLLVAALVYLDVDEFAVADLVVLVEAGCAAVTVTLAVTAVGIFSPEEFVVGVEEVDKRDIAAPAAVQTDAQAESRVGVGTAREQACDEADDADCGTHAVNDESEAVEGHDDEKFKG